MINFTILIANIGSGMGSQLGAARLLYGMGRSNGIPKKFFGAIDPKSRVPRNNVIFVGVIALHRLVKLITYDQGADLLNFGALLAFMGVNIAALVRYYFRAEEKNILNLAFAPSRFPDLRLHLEPTQRPGPETGRGLDGRRHRLRRHPDQRVSERISEF